MQSKSGSDLKVSEAIRNEIASYSAQMCTIEEVREMSRSRKVVAVGDVTAGNLNKAGIPLALEVVDLKTQRGNEGEFEHIDGSLEVENPPATLTHDLFEAVMDSLQHASCRRIEINGEEDLAVIPIIFYSDLNTVVVYGVPNRGMACINVDRGAKDYVKGLIRRMEEE